MEGVVMDIKKQNAGFSVEQLLNGSIAKNQFKVDFLPMWHYLDNMERKTNGFKDINGEPLPLSKIFEAIYEYASISVGLDKADMQTRIDNLNEQNLKWFNKANALELELKNLRQLLQEKQSSNEN